MRSGLSVSSTALLLFLGLLGATFLDGHHSQCEAAHITETAKSLLQTMDAWLQTLNPSAGLQLDAVELATQACCGRGIRATRDLAKGERVARIPLRALVNVEHAVAAFLHDGWSEQTLDHLGDLDLMAAFVLRERASPRASAWSGLWESMPVNLTTTALFLCDAQLDSLALKAPDFTSEIRDLRSSLRSRWRSSALLQSVASDPSVFMTGIALVQSRIFGVPVRSPRDGKWHKASCLVPFADLLNTGPADALNADCATDRESQFFDCFTTRTVSARDFLLAPYAQGASARHTWLAYGFVDAALTSSPDDASLISAHEMIIQETSCDSEQEPPSLDCAADVDLASGTDNFLLQ